MQGSEEGLNFVLSTLKKLPKEEIMNKASIIRSTEGRVISPLPGEQVQFKLDKHNTNGVMDFWIVTNGPKSGPPLHIHPNADELFYILEGSLLMKNGDDLTEVRAGDLVYIPKGVPHTFANMTDRPARSINVFCPSGLADFLQEVADGFAATPESVDVQEIAGRHDLEIIGPPLAVMLEHDN